MMQVMIKVMSILAIRLQCLQHGVMACLMVDYGAVHLELQTHKGVSA
jgi:hypothetical protein